MMNRRALLAAVLAVPAAAVNANPLPLEERRQVLAERAFAAVLAAWQEGRATPRDVAGACSALARSAAAAAFWTP